MLEDAGCELGKYPGGVKTQVRLVTLPSSTGTSCFEEREKEKTIELLECAIAVGIQS